MKVFLQNHYDTGAGTERYLHGVASHLVEAGYQVVFLYTRSGSKPPVKEGLLSAHYLPGLGVSTWAELWRALRSGQLRRDSKLLADMLRADQPDVLHLHNHHQAFLLHLSCSPVPVVQTLHDYQYLCYTLQKVLPDGQICRFPMGMACIEKGCVPPSPRRMAEFTVRLLNRAVCRRAQRVLVASESMRQTALCNGFRPSQVRVLPLFTWPPEGSQQQANGSARLLFVGRLAPEKGAHLLLEALVGVRGSLTIVGDGVAARQLRALAHQLGLDSRVQFTGWLGDEGLQRHYRDCAAVVIPSLWLEPFGLVGIEAMAYGKPVVAFDVGGIGEWLRDGATGFLVPRGDVRGLRERIAQFLREPELARRLGEQGRREVRERYVATVHMPKLLAIYREVARCA